MAPQTAGKPRHFGGVLFSLTSEHVKTRVPQVQTAGRPGKRVV